MKFVVVPLAEAAGSVLAHSIRLAGGALRKGTLLGADEIARLEAAGIQQVLVAHLADSDVGENPAASRVAAALAGDAVDNGTATTGRVNLFARSAGLLCLDVARIHAANRVHEGLTIATLRPDAVVEEGQMLATVKIIPYGVPESALAEVVQVLSGQDPALRVAPWRSVRAALLMTRLPETTDSVLAKMRGAVLGRLGPLGGSLLAERSVAHDEATLARELQKVLQEDPAPDLLLVSGIAATVDRGDVVPAAVIAAGGRIVHAGMPVDPGNLLVVGEIATTAGPRPVVGIPTCARSPKLNGFDFVLRRLAAGEPVLATDIMAMGVGGLLTEIESRPMPRNSRPPAPAE